MDVGLLCDGDIGSVDQGAVVGPVVRDPQESVAVHRSRALKRESPGFKTVVTTPLFIRNCPKL